MGKLRAAIVGYGNVGRGVEAAILKSPDFEPRYIISRRSSFDKPPVSDSVILSVSNYPPKDIDVAFLCGGSKNDLPLQGPFYAANTPATVDSFDTHKHIAPYIDEDTKQSMIGYLEEMNIHAKSGGNIAFVSTGWDPGLFSMERVLMESVLYGSKAYAFYGLEKNGGLSMGHSDAIRSELKDMGVSDARQYTHARHDAIERVRRGENPKFSPGDMHWRECFVLAEDGDKGAIADAVKSMPNYYEPYETTVDFVDEDGLKELDEKRGMLHDGIVLATGETGKPGSGNTGLIEYKCVWKSNPEATGQIMLASARAAHKMREEGRSGSVTIVDVPPAYFSTRSRDYIISNLI